MISAAFKSQDMDVTFSAGSRNHERTHYTQGISGKQGSYFLKQTEGEGEGEVTSLLTYLVNLLPQGHTGKQALLRKARNKQG